MSYMEDFRAEQEVVDIPGTTAISDNSQVDVDNELIKKNGIILIPQPSSDPNDPLNWSKFRKELHFAILCVFSLLLGAFSNWSVAIYEVLVSDLNITYGQLNNGVAFQYLFLAVGCLFLQPLSLKTGKRPIYLFQTLLALISHILFATTTDEKNYYGYGIVNGLSCAAMDSLVQISIADIFFLHEHGTRFGIYMFFLNTGSALGPLFAPLITDGTGNWRWCCYTILIISGVFLLIQFIFLEESLFKRPPFKDEKKLLTVALSNVHSAAEAEVDKDHGNIDKIVNNKSEVEIGSLVEIPQKKTFIQRMSLFSTDQAADANLWKLTINPLRTLYYPAVVWGAFACGIQICWFTLTGITQAQFFSSPPYNFSTSSIGLVNLSSLAGSIIGAVYLYYTDWFQLHMCKRNNGIFEPEFRLLALIPITLLNAAGLLMYGLGVHSGLQWICPIIGCALLSLGVSAGGSIVMVYIVECYPEQSLESMVTVFVFRNILGMIFTFVFEDWLDGLGIVKVTWMLFMFCILINGSLLFFTFKGKSFRKRTAKWYYDSVRSVE